MSYCWVVTPEQAAARTRVLLGQCLALGTRGEMDDMTANIPPEQRALMLIPCVVDNAANQSS